MDKYRIITSETAKQDLRDIASYIKNELQEPDIAIKTVDTIIDGICTLEEMPARINLVKDERLAAQGIRGLSINNYTAFFRINEAGKIVDIARILYSRRDWSALI